MNPALAWLLLALAAVLEAGGDAIVRLGLHHPNVAGRAALFVAGAAVLFAYGTIVNAPPWDFGIADLMTNLARRGLLNS